MIFSEAEFVEEVKRELNPPKRATAAEELLDAAHSLLIPKRELIDTSNTPITEVDLARLALAFRFYRAVQGSPALGLRSVVEDWPIEQIIREMY